MSVSSASNDYEHELWGWEEFFQQIGQFLTECERNFGSCSGEYAEYVIERLRLCIRSCSCLLDNFEESINEINASVRHRDVIAVYMDAVIELIDCLRELSKEWSRLEDCAVATSSISYRAPTISNSGRGRPRFDVSCAQIEYLRSLSFSWTNISSLLGISRMTLYRRCREFGRIERGRTLDDNNVRRLLGEIKKDHPHIGEKMVIGRFRSLGYQISRSRVRETIRRSDPINTALRWQGMKTTRRRYSVPGPNSLWHIGKLCYKITVIEFTVNH